MGSISEITPLGNLTFIAFDTETTGLSPLDNQLVELSGVKFSLDGEVISTFSTLIDPQEDIPPEATEVHGITSDMVQGQPNYRQAVPEFFQWAGQSNIALVAHNAQFDIGFLDVAISKLSLPPPPHPVVDTLSLSRRLIPQAPNHKLRTLAEHLGLDSGGYHRALADSYHVRNLLLRLLALMPQAATWSDLSSLSQVFRFSDPSLQPGRIPEQVHQIQEAISAGVVLNMTYRGSQSSPRLVTPLSVHKWKGNMYLTAYCHTSLAERTFRLDKIECCEPLTSGQEVKPA